MTGIGRSDAAQAQSNYFRTDFMKQKENIIIKTNIKTDTCN